MVSHGLFDLQWWAYPLVALALTHATIAAVTILPASAPDAPRVGPAPEHQPLFPVLALAHHRHGDPGVGGRPPQASRPMRNTAGSAQPTNLRHRAGAVGRRVSLRARIARPRDGRDDTATARRTTGSRPVSIRAVPTAALSSWASPTCVAFGIGRGMLDLRDSDGLDPVLGRRCDQRDGALLGLPQLPGEDASTNLVPIGVLIGGEEFHNNHHAHPTSAKLSSAWYEFDIGWMYIRLLETLGLARVSRTAPIPQFSSGQDRMRRRHLAGRHHPPPLRAGAIHPLGQECMPQGDQPARRGAPQPRRETDASSAAESAALVAPAHLASKSAPTADVRPGFAQDTPAADRLFDATGAECALEPIQRYSVRRPVVGAAA